MSKTLIHATAIVSLALAAHSAAFAATSDVAKADAARKKPLQRCDQMSDQAELDCLQKARERILEARKKRESAVEKREEKQARNSEDKQQASAKKNAPKTAAQKE